MNSDKTFRTKPTRCPFNSFEPCRKNCELNVPLVESSKSGWLRTCVMAIPGYSAILDSSIRKDALDSLLENVEG